MKATFASLIILVGICACQQISIYIKDGTYTIKDGLNSDADVEAYFVDSCMTTGWGRLQVQINDVSSSTAQDSEKMFAAGIAEGYLTSKQIYQTYTNLLNTTFWDFTNGPSDALQEFIDTQLSWENEMIANNSTSPYWKMVQNVNLQLSGLWYGYNLTASKNNVPEQSSIWMFKFLNILPDLMDLESVLNISKRVNISRMTPNEFLHYRLSRGHCSAVIKVSPLLDNIYLGHSTWMIYQNMNRIYKYYIFNLNNMSSSYYGNEMMFSSYPGMLQSQDDFYVLNNLVMLQTTNSIFNTSLYNLLSPKNMLWYWERIRIAHALSNSGSEWYSNFGEYNSGTYNNQYMILDYKLFKENEPLSDDLLWIVEQIPGLVLGEDRTDVLRRGYWGSYNVPAIEEIYNKSGYPEIVKLYGTGNSYDLAPRARIFRRDANNIDSVNDLETFLRYNDYTSDSIENKNPMWAICSRGDLPFNNTPGSTFGCYDTKAADLKMILNMTARAISGPTTSNGINAFNFNDFPQTPHAGIATVMNFTWQTMNKLF